MPRSRPSERRARDYSDRTARRQWARRFLPRSGAAPQQHSCETRRSGSRVAGRPFLAANPVRTDGNCVIAVRAFGASGPLRTSGHGGCRLDRRSSSAAERQLPMLCDTDR
jgi:hypothetical protein